MAAYDLIGDLAKIGVASFKIEGRLKSAHYVAATCQTYRAAIDASGAASDFQISDSQKHDLEQTFSRGFTQGFLGGVNHQQLVSARFPKARGTRIGTVFAKTTHSLIVQLDTRNSRLESFLKPGDGVVFDEGHPEQDEQGGRIFAVRPANHIAPGSPGVTPPPHMKIPSSKNSAGLVELEFRTGDVNLAYINPGALVWKTDDPAIKRRLEHSFSREIVVHRTTIDFVVQARVGELLAIVGRADGREAEVLWDEKPLEAASKFPVNEAMVREQLGRLGETPYELGKVALETDGLAMVPKSVLNDLRRRVCEELLRGRKKSVELSERDVLGELRGKCISDTPPSPGAGTPGLFVLTRTMEQ